jgi:hypothetical protein
VVHVAVHLLPLALSEQVQAGFWGMAGLVMLGLPVQAAQQAGESNSIYMWPQQSMQHCLKEMHFSQTS